MLRNNKLRILIALLGLALLVLSLLVSLLLPSNTVQERTAQTFLVAMIAIGALITLSSIPLGTKRKQQSSKGVQS